MSTREIPSPKLIKENKERKEGRKAPGGVSETGSTATSAITTMQPGYGIFFFA
jgi:hypothetical protein